MHAVLGIMAGVLFLLYSLYFIQIIKGNPQVFEIELLKALAAWIVNTGMASKRQLWIMLLASLLLEAGYFSLTFTFISNPFMLMLTACLAGIESYHLMSLAWRFKRFFGGQLAVTGLFNWRVERISAIAFFTHSLLVMITLIFL